MICEIHYHLLGGLIVFIGFWMILAIFYNGVLKNEERNRKRKKEFIRKREEDRVNKRKLREMME